MKTISKEKVVYSNLEKIVYFKRVLAALEKRRGFLESKISSLEKLDPDAYEHQDWGQSVSDEIKELKRKGAVKKSAAS